MTPEREADIRSYAEKNPQSWPAMTFRELLAALDQERARVARREATIERVGELLATEQDAHAALRARVAKLVSHSTWHRTSLSTDKIESGCKLCAARGDGERADIPHRSYCPLALAALETPDE